MNIGGFSALFLFAILKSIPVGAIEPPSQEVIDKTIVLALAIDFSEIDRKPGSWQCEIMTTSFTGTGDTLQRAQLMAGLRCIQAKCARFGDDTSYMVTQDPEFKSLLKSLGLDSEAIGKIHEIFSDSGFKQTLNSACSGKDHTAALARTMVHASCFTLPFECGERPSCTSR